jgi:hypothetical protein
VARSAWWLSLVAMLALGAQAADGPSADEHAPPGIAIAPGAAAPAGAAAAEPGATSAPPNEEGALAGARRSATPHLHGARPQYTQEARLQRLTTSLGLSTEQQAKVKTILEQRQARALQIYRSAPPSAVDRVRRYQALDRQTVARIRSVLTEEQRRKYEPPHATAEASAPTPEAEVH